MIWKMVLEEGLEPSRSFEQKILSLLCLPIPPPELKLINDFKERGELPLYLFIILCLSALLHELRQPAPAQAHKIRPCVRVAVYVARDGSRVEPRPGTSCLASWGPLLSSSQCSTLLAQLVSGFHSEPGEMFILARAVTRSASCLAWRGLHLILLFQLVNESCPQVDYRCHKRDSA